jgi:diguanylate cyclase (GGDEF)-like protein
MAGRAEFSLREALLSRVKGGTIKLFLAHPAFIIFGGVSLALVMLSLCAFVLLQSRRDAFDYSTETSRNVALIAQRDIVRNLELYSLSLQAVVDGFQDPEVMRLPVSLRRQVLFDRAATAKYLQSVAILDATGRVTIDANGDVPPQGGFEDREYFTVQRDNPDVGLYISAPLRPRLGKPELSIALSRRLTNHDGSFGGVAVMLVNEQYFRDLFSGLALGPNGSITLFETDGTVLMRSPNDGENADFKLNTPTNLLAASIEDDGRLVSIESPDGIPRLYVFKHFAEFPLVLSVGLAQKDIYAAWTHRTIWIGSLMVVFGLAFIGLSVLFARQLSQRARAEAELQMLARTDGLTGLSNRRTLDEILDGEWRRAKRSGAPLSVLFVDIDWFKAYNDTYGHQAGDDALIEVALSIVRCLRRPGGRAARYGGEEFLVVLPDTGPAAALVIAEKIHTSVRQLDIQHESGANGRISVSVGVASGTSESFADVAALVKAADDAMYQVKSTGRDKVLLYAMPSPAHNLSAA